LPTCSINFWNEHNVVGRSDFVNTAKKLTSDIGPNGIGCFVVVDPRRPSARKPDPT